MMELTESKAQPAKKKAKKLKKLFNLLDFVVVKKKTKKSQPTKVVKVSKQIQKRGKVRKKKITTIKKKIIRERLRKQTVDLPLENHTVSRSDNDDTIEDSLASKVAQIQLGESGRTLDKDLLALNSVLTATAPPFIPSKSLRTSLPPVKSSILLPYGETPVASIDPMPVATNEAIQFPTTHSRNFREYCNHFITPEIKHLTELVLKDLFKFQENKFQQNPVKAKANKRYVVGFKEVKKFLIVKRLKLVIIAPDLERNAEVEALVDEIKALADQHKIPYVFSIKRRHIGYLLLKKVPVSLVGVFDYQGTDENANRLLKLVKDQKVLYRNKVNAAC